MEKGWSIDQTDWKKLEQLIPPNRSWGSVLLTPNEDVMVPETAGVYAICGRPPIADFVNNKSVYSCLATPIYIGCSETNIKTRFLSHCNSPSAKLKLAKLCYGKVQLKFWFIQLNKETVRTAEAFLIQCFGPPVNQLSGTISGTIKSAIPV